MFVLSKAVMTKLPLIHTDTYFNFTLLKMKRNFGFSALLDEHHFSARAHFKTFHGSVCSVSGRMCLLQTIDIKS